jgi:hypothetical protein
VLAIGIVLLLAAAPLGFLAAVPPVPPVPPVPEDTR